MCEKPDLSGANNDGFYGKETIRARWLWAAVLAGLAALLGLLIALLSHL